MVLEPGQVILKNCTNVKHLIEGRCYEYNTMELFRNYFRTCSRTSMHGYYGICPLSFLKGYNINQIYSFSLYLYIYYNPSVNNLIYKQWVHLLKTWLQKKKPNNNNQKTEIYTFFSFIDSNTMEFNKNSLLCFFQFVTVGGIESLRPDGLSRL